MILETFNDGRLIVKFGDITAEVVDAIVNAANSTLLGGGGVDGAIHAKGGPAILEECRELRRTTYPDGLPTGEAVITTGGELPARFVIHTVGPIFGMNDGRDAELLAASYRSSIDLAISHELSSIAFPAISTGAYGYPKHEAASIVFQTLSEIPNAGTSLEVRLVFFSETDARKFIRHR
ncbi:MAG: O-acetyl-ADP-ribose deacetylase [Acidobacteriota bacterium]